MAARVQKTVPVLELHRTADDPRRAELYADPEASPQVTEAEMRRLWSNLQRAAEDVVLALPKGHTWRRPVLKVAEIARDKARESRRA